MDMMLEWLVGGTLVLVHAHARFNTPRSNRSSTTRARYYSAAFSYYLIICLLFLLLGGGVSASPDLAEQLIKLFLAGSGVPDEQLKGLFGPLLAALLLTTLLPNLPGLRRLDAGLRNLFQEMGDMPWAALRLRGRLWQSEFAVPRSLDQQVQRKWDEFVPTDVAIPPECSLKGQWTKTIALYLQVRDWSEIKGYQRFRSEMADELQAIEADFDAVRDRAQSCFRLLREPGSGADETTRKALKECKTNVRERTDDLYEKLCEFVARGVLCCEYTSANRERKLRQMGFVKFSDSNYPVSANQAITIAAMVFIVVAVGMGIAGQQVGDLRRVLMIAAMVATIYPLAVTASIYPKTVWGFADIRKAGQRPVIAYLLSGVLAAGLAVVVSLTFKFVMYGNFVEALENVRLGLPWLLMSFTVGAVTAFLADDFGADRKREPRWGRYLEGLAEGVVLAGAALAVRWLLEAVGVPAARIPEWQVLIPTSALIGLVIGTLVPHWYRNAPSTGDEQRRPARVGMRTSATSA